MEIDIWCNNDDVYNEVSKMISSASMIIHINAILKI